MVLLRVLAASLAVSIIALLATTSTAAERTAAELLPASVVGYLDVPQPNDVIGLVLDHPLAGEVAKAPEYQKALEAPQYRKFQAALAELERRLGAKWRDAASRLTSGGLTIAFDLPTKGVVALSQAQDEQAAAKALEAFMDLARQAASAEGKPELVKEDKHAETAVYQIGEAHLAVQGTWLIVSSKKPLLRSVIDLAKQPGESLAADGQFQRVIKERPAQADAWLYIDLRVLRLTGVLKQALGKKSDNPAAEILAGGVLGALPDAPYVTAALNLSASRVRLTTSLPCDTKAVAKSREFYLGPEGTGAAPPLLAPKDTLLAVSTYRDFASLWRHAPDLFDDGINAKFAEAESNLTTFFAGRNFRDDILGNLEPQVQVVVTRQQFPQEGITPAIKLPAVAGVFRMKRPEETTRIFKVTFQSAVGFLNVVGAMNGVDPLDLNSEKTDDALVISGSYLPPAADKPKDEAALHYNASPTLAFVGDRFILASSRPLALELVEHVRKGEAPPPAEKTNTSLRLDGRIGQAALAENRGPLIAQNMLEKGHDRAAAEHEIDRVLAALRHVAGASLDLKVAEKTLELSLEVRLADGK
jgi:hypothetical protein